ncbi:hypothetical protein EUTSA_v10009362mg [Eutrema salsugineum]|uniref:Uncharacterized protein n=1 Tax=Eutrema salsugineum TaxID=72664 RepID=V4L1G2_EUTSA|nr:uncharacterized protein LOC18991826 [Eutrema salsugineum]ESQ33568.1 hypothetical protein EUTSA_v10009362mg [Eutrema salsugineum]
MAETVETVKLSVRLLVDEEKNKVVLAETGKDFVDVLFSFLTLPMGTIVRLLEKHRKSPQVVVGCLKNLYKSVSDMGAESFQTESCKQVLMYPRSVNHDKYRRVKLKIDDTEAVNYFVCSRCDLSESFTRFYSIVNTEECGCGRFVDSKIVRGLMNRKIQLEEEKVQENIMRNESDEFFVSSETSFVITDDLLPSYYSCPKQLLDVVTEQQEIYYSFYRYRSGRTSDHKFTRKMPDCLNSQSESNLDMYDKHKKAGARVLYMRSFGFVRRNTRFLVTDDLVIKPKDSVSNISLLKLQMHLEEKDVDEQVITIGRLEAMNLLRASMMTSSALTTCFWNLIAKKAKEES